MCYYIVPKLYYIIITNIVSKLKIKNCLAHTLYRQVEQSIYLWAKSSKRLFIKMIYYKQLW